MINTLSKYKWVISSILVGFVVTGCGGSDDDDDDEDIANRPQITATTPSANATNVDIKSPVSVTFSSAIATNTLNADTFTLKCGSTAITGNITYDANTRVATFNHEKELPNNSNCIAKLTTGITDTMNRSLDEDFTFSFNTVADTTAPTVSNSNINENTSEVALNTKINITFSEDIDPATINNTTFTVMNGVNQVAGTIEYDKASRTATFTPAANLNGSTQYTIMVNTGVKDMNGNALASNYSYTFTTALAPDTTAPSIVLTSPVENAMNVCRTTPIRVVFNEDIAPASVTNSVITLMAGATAINGNITYDNSSKTALYTLTDASGLPANSQITMNVKGGELGFKDVAGNPLTNDKAVSFTTSADACVVPV